jgi:hypothetical protein
MYEFFTIQKDKYSMIDMCERNGRYSGAIIDIFFLYTRCFLIFIIVRLIHEGGKGKASQYSFELLELALVDMDTWIRYKELNLQFINLFIQFPLHYFHTSIFLYFDLKG